MTPPEPENFCDFGTPKMRFFKGKTLKTGPKKVTKIILIKTPQIQIWAEHYKDSPVKFRNFGPICSLRGGFLLAIARYRGNTIKDPPLKIQIWPNFQMFEGVPY